MKLETAQALVKAAESRGYEDVTLHENYSGRGMYGKSTAAVSADSVAALLVAAALAATMVPKEDRNGLIEDLRWVCQDQLGMGIIVY